MITRERLLAHRDDPKLTLQLLEEALGEDFSILTEFNTERNKVEWLSRTKVLEGRSWRIAKNYSEASRFAHTNISRDFQNNLRRQLEDELALAKPEYYGIALYVYVEDFIEIVSIPHAMYSILWLSFFGIMMERILKKDKKEAKFNKIWKLYQYGHWPVRWSDDGVQIIY
jgi:hypothetical protein